MRVISFSHSHCLMNSSFMKKNCQVDLWSIPPPHWPPCDLILVCVAMFIIDGSWFLGEALALALVTLLKFFLHIYIFQEVSTTVDFCLVLKYSLILTIFPSQYLFFILTFHHPVNLTFLLYSPYLPKYHLCFIPTL